MTNNIFQQFTYNNKLPLNLLHSSSEYNRMLITNGRYLKSYKQDYHVGFIPNLQFINQHIFEKQQLKKKQIHNYRILDKKKIQKKELCQCCCCDSYCQQCEKIHKKQFYQQISHQSDKVNRQDNIFKDQNHESSSYKKQNNKKKMRKRVITSAIKNMDLSNKQIYQNKMRLSNLVSLERNPSKQFLQKNLIQKSSSSSNIDQIVKKSITCFYRQRKMLQKQRLLEQIQKQQKRKNIREQYINVSKNNKSKFDLRSQQFSNIQSKSSKRQSMKKYSQYVNCNKQKLSQSLKYCNKINPQVAEIGCSSHKMKNQLSIKEMQTRMKERQKYAKHIISQQKKQEQKSRYKIQYNLKKLEKSRLNIIEQCPTIAFKPTSVMINQAFKIEQEKPKEKKNNKKKQK